MKFYSEVLNKVFNTEEDLARAEKHFTDNQKDKTDKVKELENKKTALTKEINTDLEKLAKKLDELSTLNKEMKKLETPKTEDDIFSEIINAIFK